MPVQEIQKRAAPILKRHDAVEAYVFGSAARGEATPESDIDILVRFKTIQGLLEHIRVKYDLQDTLGQRVDLVQMEALRKEMRSSVDRDKVRII